MTKQEERIVNSTAYGDLVLKLGVCASGNNPRLDSDADDSNSSAPTLRLDRLLSLQSNENTRDSMIGNDFQNECL